MPPLATKLLRKPYLTLLYATLGWTALPLLAQVPTGSSFRGTSASAPGLPDAPDSTEPAAAAAAPRSAGLMAPEAGIASEPDLILPRNFRIAPAAARSGMPGKFSYYLDSTWSVRNLVEAALVAGLPRVPDPPAEPLQPTTDTPANDYAYQVAMDNYGDAMHSWARTVEENARYTTHRFESGLATAETRDLASNLLLPLAFHQQGRYLPAPLDADFGERMRNALTSIVVTRNDAGFVVPNYSKLGGTALAAFLGKSIYAPAFGAPELDSMHFVTRYIGYSLLGDLATNTAHELVRAALEPDATFFELHGRATDDSYYPLSLGGKLVLWLRSTYAPRNFISAALITSLPSIPTRPQQPSAFDPKTWGGSGDYDDAYNQYGLHLLAWKDTLEEISRSEGRRFAGGLSEAESQMFLQNFAIPVLFNMDPRYIPLGSGYSASQRTAHAFTGLFLSHTDSGAKTINLPVLGGTVGSAYAAKELYYPQLGTPELATGSLLARTVGLNLGADLVYNLVGEFMRHRSY